MVKPFLKWAGGKTQLLPELIKRVPKKFRAYHEPFLGGGALFFALSPEKAVLSDTNAELITTYVALKNNPRAVLNELRVHELKNSENWYYMIRDRTEVDSSVKAAARMIYLNKTCFNGLYRVNKKGGFNVPYGYRPNPRIVDKENILSASKALSNVEIVCQDFSQTTAKKGDLVYFDPPYHPVNETSFVAYTNRGFGEEEQFKLSQLALRLRKRGVHIILSNSDTPFIRRLYPKAKGWKVDQIEARRAINRTTASELIIY